MSWTPQVRFENIESGRRPTDQEIEDKVTQGRVSNTALSIYQARKRPSFGTPMPYAPSKFARRHYQATPTMQSKLVIRASTEATKPRSP